MGSVETSLLMISRGQPVYKHSLALLLAVILAACSSVPEELRPKEIDRMMDREVYLDMRWKTDYGTRSEKKRYPLAPAFHQDTVFISSPNGQIEARDVETGKRIWHFALQTEISAGITWAGDYLYVVSSHGELYQLSSADGSPRWKKSLASESLAPVAAEKDLVVVQLHNGDVVAFNDAGEELWSFNSSLPVLTLRGHAAPQIYRNLVLLGLANGRVVALEKTSGKLQWESRIAVPRGRTEIERIVDVDQAPLIDATRAYAVSYQGRLVVLDLNTGRQGWQKEVSSYGGVSQGLGNLYVTDDKSVVYAFGKQSGEQKWQQSAYYRRALSTPVMFDRYLVVSDFEGYLHILDPLEGRPLGRKKVDGGGLVKLLFTYRNKLFLYARDGDFYAYEIERRN